MKFERRKIILVDGYNVINSWEELSGQNLGSAREQLDFTVAEYVMYHNIKGYIIYDAYNVRGEKGKNHKIGNLEIVFTQENQTADSYIEKFIAEFKHKRHYILQVVTDDGAERQNIYGKGAVRISTVEFYTDIQTAAQDIKNTIKTPVLQKNTLDNILDYETIKRLEIMRKMSYNAGTENKKNKK